MKSKEEIEQLAFLEYPRLINDPYNPMVDDNADERKIWINAYTQCQEDMADEIKKQIYDFTVDLKESTSTYVKQNCEGAIFGLNRLLQSLNKQD